MQRLLLYFDTNYYFFSSAYRHGDEHHSVAVPAGAVAEQPVRAHHLVDQHGRRVQAAQRRRGCPALGPPQEQAQHELRQAEQGAQVLLRQEHHPESPRTEVRLQVSNPSIIHKAKTILTSSLPVTLGSCDS